MNRVERRAFTKKLPKSISQEEKNRYIEFATAIRNKDDVVLEGDKVRLNYDKITNQPNYESFLDTYKDIVEKLKDKVCTVVYDSKYKNDPVLVCLEEDPTPTKFLFFVGDLIKEESTNN